MNMLKNVKKVYFIGIGGIGMSALARILLEKGYLVYGSDIKQTAITDKLKRAGAHINIGHSKKCPADIDLAVYTSCISKDNPEIKALSRRGVKIVNRGRLLAELFNKSFGIAVSGTHGKTTTSALIGHMLKFCGLDPTVAVGAEVISLGGNAVTGQSDLFVAESDESDGSFLELKSNYAVITNIEEEHLDYYKDLAHIKASYAAFADNVKDNGCLIACADDANIKNLLKRYKKPITTYGFNKNADYRASNLQIRGLSTDFDCLEKEKLLNKFTLNIPGKHNVQNALAAIAIAKLLGLTVDKIKDALASYKGSLRRFEIKSDSNEIMLIEDYAHHPTEIKATIEAARNLNPKRVIVAFQPHRFSRTKHLKLAFSSAFDKADYLIITDIYAASEMPIKGISSQIIYKEIKEKSKNVCYLPKDDIAEHIMKIAEIGDLIIIMGAGDIGEISNEIAQKLKK
jgi:UDP-N-acetylmuramate--alanine ligase